MKPETRRYRLMDLIDGDMGEKRTCRFFSGNHDRRIDGIRKIPDTCQFFRMPSVSDMLKRQVTFHSYEKTVTVRYI